MQGDADTVIEKFGVLRGVDTGKPVLRLDARVARHFGGDSILVVEKAFQSGDSVVYVVSPRPGAPRPLPKGSSAEVEGPTQESDVSYVVPDLQWGKTYTFVVLNYTGGTTADGTSVFTQIVTLHK